MPDRRTVKAILLDSGALTLAVLAGVIWRGAPMRACKSRRRARMPSSSRISRHASKGGGAAGRRARAGMSSHPRFAWPVETIGSDSQPVAVARTGNPSAPTIDMALHDRDMSLGTVEGQHLDDEDLGAETRRVDNDFLAARVAVEPAHERPPASRDRAAMRAASASPKTTPAAANSSLRIAALPRHAHRRVALEARLGELTAAIIAREIELLRGAS